jgi:hypothetical protein
MELSSKIEILADLLANYKGSDDFADFIAYNDIGLPLAYAVREDLVTLNPLGEVYIVETYDVLIASLEADPNGEYESLEDLLGGLSK